MRWLRADLAISLKRALPALALSLLCGCHPAAPVAEIQNSEAGGIPPDSWRADDTRFSESDRRLIAATRTYLEQRRQKAVDGYYRVLRKTNGCEVQVTFVAGYDKGRPLSYPGGHCRVLLTPDGSVTQALPGP